MYIIASKFMYEVQTYNICENEHAIYKINVFIHTLCLVSDILTKLFTESTSSKQKVILQIWTQDVYMLYGSVMPVYVFYSLCLLYGCFVEFVNNLVVLAPNKVCMLVTMVLLRIT